MQFKTVVAVNYNSHNEFGEDILSSQVLMKCTIVKRNKDNKQTLDRRWRNYDMKIITAFKDFSPYKDIWKDDSLTFVYDGTEYRAISISEICDFNGKVKFVEVQLEEKKA